MNENPTNTLPGPPIHAVIGVWHQGAKTFYVKRSEQMANYPLVWSLLSIQFRPEQLPDQLDLASVQPLMDKMARERLRGAPLRVKRYVSSATCSDNPMGRRVHLHLYEVEFDGEPQLDPAFYVDAAWLGPDEYVQRSTGSTCGLCMRMWSDHCVRHGLADRRFAPPLRNDDDDEAAA